MTAQRRQIAHADDLRRQPTPPVDEARAGRWVVRRATRQPGPAGSPLVTWSLVLRHADDGHIERVDTDALPTTVYREGQEIDGRIELTRSGPLFRRARPAVGSREA